MTRDPSNIGTSFLGVIKGEKKEVPPSPFPPNDI
jgi:hypothetical protein